MQVPFPFNELIEPPALDWETIARLQQLHMNYLDRAHDEEEDNDDDDDEDNDEGDSGSMCDNCAEGKFCCGYVHPDIHNFFEAELKDKCSGL